VRPEKSGPQALKPDQRLISSPPDRSEPSGHPGRSAAEHWRWVAGPAGRIRVRAGPPAAGSSVEMSEKEPAYSDARASGALLNVEIPPVDTRSGGK